MTVTRFIGVDLAWGEGDAHKVANETGVVVLDRSGTVLDAGWTVGVDATTAWIERASDPAGTIAFVDAPLVIENDAGQRACENQVSKRYGRWHVSANTTNKESPRQAGVLLRGALERHGWSYSSGHAGPPRSGQVVSECYPYATLVGVPELYATAPPPGHDRPQRPRYKRKPKTMRVDQWRPLRATQWDDLVARLDDLRSAEPPLDMRSHDVTRSLLTRPEHETEREYKHREDVLDAMIAAWTALLWVAHPDRCQVLGPPDLGASTATIIAPAVADQRR